MKKITLLLVVLATLLACPALAAEPVGFIPLHGSGSSLLTPLITTLPTDASATITTIVKTQGFTSIVVDITTDKGGTLTITPLPDLGSDSDVGQVSDTLTVPTSTATRGIYSQIGAPRAKVVFTKTVAGSATSMRLAIRGTLQ